MDSPCCGEYLVESNYEGGWKCPRCKRLYPFGCFALKRKWLSEQNEHEDETGREFQKVEEVLEKRPVLKRAS